jgi:serine/threonine protein kinase
MLLQENTIFDNRYQLERLLGRGGFSEVWLAKDNWTRLQIAIKVYAPGQGMEANGLQEFCGELANVFDLNHTNLLKPTHVDSWNDMPYLIMAYCSQGPLSKKIGKLSEDQIWKMIHDVASGLAYLHSRDVVHQDIKPDNILIDELGNYVITDFGISTRARSALRKSVVGGAVSGGTLAYMGPERFSRQPAPTKASDIWSLGATIYEIIEDNVPFGEMGGGMQKGGAEIPEITANVSERLKDTIYKMLSKETWDRPTAETLVEWSLSKNNEEPKVAPKQERASRATARFKDVPPVPPVTPTQPADEATKREKISPEKKPSTSTNWIWYIPLGILVLGLVAGGGLGIYLKVQNDKKVQQAMYEQHEAYVADFEAELSSANISNVNALQSAVMDLASIKQIEDNKKFKRSKIYDSKSEAFLIKADSLYNEADRKYQKAPEGTETERRNKEKRDRIGYIKSQLP